MSQHIVQTEESGCHARVDSMQREGYNQSQTCKMTACYGENASQQQHFASIPLVFPVDERWMKPRVTTHDGEIGKGVREQRCIVSRTMSRSCAGRLCWGIFAKRSGGLMPKANGRQGLDRRERPQVPGSNVLTETNVFSLTGGGEGR